MKCIEQPALSFDLDGNGISMLHAAAGEILELLHYESIPDVESVIGISGREAADVCLYCGAILDTQDVNEGPVRVSISIRALKGCAASIRHLSRPESPLLDELQTRTGFLPDEFRAFSEELDGLGNGSEPILVRHAANRESMFALELGLGEVLGLLGGLQEVERALAWRGSWHFEKAFGIAGMDWKRLEFRLFRAVGERDTLDAVFPFTVKPSELNAVKKAFSAFLVPRKMGISKHGRLTGFSYSVYSILAREIQRCIHEEC
jgi:hypothetical protein